jgi:replicative DNA helicase
MAKNFAGDPSRDQMLERPLPHSADAERAILGAIILDNALVNQSIELLRPDDFYVRAHYHIFRAMISMSERGAEINPILLGEELRREGVLEQVGGITFISELTYGLPHFTNVAAYAKVVKDKSLMRQLVKVANKITSEALEEEDEAQIILDHAEQMIFALADERTRQGFAHVKPVADAILEKIQEMGGRGSVLTGLTTGFTEMDAMTSGLQPSDLIIVAARPSMGKCLAAESEILLADGNVSTIEEIYRERNARLLTLGDDFKFRETAPSAFVDDGLKPVFRVTTRLGRSIETTLSHPFLTLDGWQQLFRLKAGDRVAVPRALGVFGVGEMRECEVKLLAYLIGDGGLTSTSPIFTVGKPALREDFESAVAEFGGVATRAANSADRTFSLRVRKSKTHPGRTNPLTAWLRGLGVYGCGSRAKFVPAQVFKLRRELVALFLNRLFATDGWASALASGQSQLGFASASERLARQVQHLLLRFGVVASLKRRSVKYRDGRRTAWQLDITDRLSIETFISEIGIHGKESALSAVRLALSRRKYQTNRDLIPVDVWRRLADAKGAESWASLARRAGLKSDTNIHVGRRALSRNRLLSLAGALDSEELSRLATSEVYWDEIVSIEPAGTKQVYDLTIPDTHNFVANDICVHNTSFCLTLAQNAALQSGAVVGVFSLEMSKESLVMRMLCSEGHVDAHRFRNGFLSREEWGRMAGALGRLAETKIYIDDTPGISVLEMRAKARRLAAEQKRLDLIIVDYLQLMSGSSRRVESRQQEVSQISRELKGLAKELNVPLVALSQLSRAPEARTDHRPQLADLRECVTGDTLVVLADGSRVPIARLVGTEPEVLALSDDGQIVPAKSDKVWAVGRRPVFEVRLASGRRIRATAKHRLRGWEGWQRVAELRPSDRLAVARRLPEPREVASWSDTRVALLGQLIGDGSYLSHQPMRYTTSSEENSRAVSEAAREEFGADVKRYAGRRDWHQLLISGNGNRWKPAGVNLWLRELGIYGQRSHEKRIPEAAFRLGNRQIALLLRHLWATDGCIYTPPAEARSGSKVYYSTSSAGLAQDVAALLLRLGIIARIYTIKQGRFLPSYHVAVSGTEDQRRFLDAVGAFGPRVAQAERLAAWVAVRQPNTNVDTLPQACFEEVKLLMRAQGISQRAMAAARGTSYGGTAHFRFAPSRAVVAEYASMLGDDDLGLRAHDDLFWDRVVAVEPAGEEEVFDLTVPGPASWLADGIVSHNSGAIEQDADVVAFIYREEQYNRTEENAGLAEIILAKQRNGPTGTVKLAFLKEFTRFENMWRE